MLDFVTKPTLLLRTDRLEENIRRMTEKARRNGVRFRPHFKTHQSGKIAEIFRRMGVEAITVSSVSMARFFASRGWKDITIAFPLNLREIDQILHLAEEVSLNLVLGSVEAAGFLVQALSDEASGDSGDARPKLGIYLKIDAGNGRTGIPMDDLDAAAAVAEEVSRSPRLRLRGLLTHSGDTYRAAGPDEVGEIFRAAVRGMRQLADRLGERGFPGLEVSAGDTPGSSILEDFPGVDELRPGNFVFYDAKQLLVGSCREEDIAAAVACPVVAKHPRQGKVIIYGGAVHLSKDFFLDSQGEQVYGRVALPAREGWGPLLAQCRLSSVSQEHGTVMVDPATMKTLEIGDLLLIVSAHVCLTADLLGEYYSPEGELIDRIWTRTPI